MPRTAVPGTIYLLHFTPKGYKHAAHYLGTTASSGFLEGLRAGNSLVEMLVEG